MNITNYSLALDDRSKIVTLDYYGNENIIIRNKTEKEETRITVPLIIMKKFMEMIDET